MMSTTYFNVENSSACMKAQLTVSTGQPIHPALLAFSAAPVPLLPGVLILAKCQATFHVCVFSMNKHRRSDHILS